MLADRRKRGLRVPHEFDTFVFFAWPAVVPYYLYRSRGRRGLLLGAGIWALYIAPYVTSVDRPDRAEPLAFELRPLDVTALLPQCVEASFCARKASKGATWVAATIVVESIFNASSTGTGKPRSH